MLIVKSNIVSRPLLEILIVTALLVFLLPVLVFLSKREGFSRDQKRLIIVIASMGLNDVLTYVLAKNGLTNLWVFHIYYPLVFVLVFRVFMVYFEERHRTNYLGLLSTMFVLFSLVNTFWFQGLDQLNSNTIVVANILFVAVAIAYLLKLIESGKENPMVRNPGFWISVGIIVYYSSSWIFFVFSESLTKRFSDYYLISWMLNSIFYISLICCYTVALWVKPQS